MYGKPIQIGLKQRKMLGREARNVQGKMPIFGTNLKDDSQFLDTRAALKIENYLVHGIASMQKRPGQIINFNTLEVSTIRLDEEYVLNYDVIGYGTKVRLFSNTDGSFTDIKTNFSANNGGFTGGRYGDYFFVNNFVDGLWRISQTLNYDAQTVNFTIGKRITGGLSGATAMILEDADAGATGTLTLGEVKGTFLDNEIFTDEAGGSATVNGVLTFAITQVVGAPKAKIFRIIGNRAILVNLAINSAGYNYSAADLGTSPPFTNWTTGTGYNDPGDGSYRNGGACTDCAIVDNNIIFIGQENGWYAFKISQTTLTDNTGANVSAKFDEPVGYRENFPIYRCVTTNPGMIVANNSGIQRLVSLGQPNVRYSDQWEVLTDDLGVNYFNDVNFSNTDITYDTTRNFLYVTVGKSSQTNNLVLAVKINANGSKSTVKTGATSFLTGWNVLRFLLKGNNIYGTSAIKGIRHQLFVGQKDVQSSIHTEYLQELNFGLNGAFKMEEFYTHGELSPTSLIKISFDRFDETGFYKARVKKYTWEAREAYPGGASGWGEAGFVDAGWGGGATLSGLISDYTGAKPKLRQMSRVYLRYESDDFADHIINWFAADVAVTKQIRNRNLDEVFN